MNIRIQVLVENTTPLAGLVGEYGFAALIEADGRRYLFDTGSAGALIENARFLKADLAGLDALIISHGHFDHTGAVVPVLEQNPGLSVFGHPLLFGPRFISFDNGKQSEIGAPFTLERLQNAGAVFTPVSGFTRIDPGVFATGPIPRNTSFEDTGGNFLKKEADGLIKDAIDDEIALVIDHADGLVVASGCSHAGLINTLDYAMKMTGRNRIQMFIGGTHLMKAGPERMEKTINALKAMDFDRLAVGHCTGFNAASELKQVFKDKIVKVETGMVFRFQ